MSNPITPTVEESLLLTSTTATALVVGGAIGATTGTGGIKAGPIVSSSSVSDAVGTMATIRGGGIGVPSQAALDFIYASSSTQLGRLAKGSAGQIVALDSAAASYVFVSQQMQLLREASGTNSTAGATIVDQFAVSGLTIKDTLYVVVRQANTGSAGGIQGAIYNSTDSVTITALSSIGQNYYLDYATIGAQTVTKVAAMTIPFTGTPAATRSTFATNWTGSWNLALRHGGITAPDTWEWEWAVYRIAGQ